MGERKGGKNRKILGRIQDSRFGINFRIRDLGENKAREEAKAVGRKRVFKVFR